MRFRKIGIGLSLCLTVPAMGCITVRTTDLRLRDASEVSLYAKGEAAPAIPSGSSTSATLGAGRYLVPSHIQDFEIQAAREPSGLLRLHCDGCQPTSFLPGLAGFSGESDVVLVGADARIPPAPASKVSVQGADFVVSRDICWVTRTTDRYVSCEVQSQVSLVIPKADVLELHTHAEPSRVWGAVLCTVGGLGLAVALAAVSTTVHSSPDGVSVDRAGLAVGAVAGAPSLALLGTGLWNLLTRSTDERQTLQVGPGR